MARIAASAASPSILTRSAISAHATGTKLNDPAEAKAAFARLMGQVQAFWFLPDMDDLRQLMRYVFSHPGEARFSLKVSLDLKRKA